MAKVSLTKLNIVKTINPIEIEINGEKIQVIQYLPLEQKAALLSSVVNDVLEPTGANSPVREMLYSMIYIIKYYTNINITETMINNASKTYDILVQNNIIDNVIKAIPEDEYRTIMSLIHRTIKDICNYRLSMVGVLDFVRGEQAGEIKDVNEIVNQLQALEGNSMFQEVMNKLQ